MEFVAALIVLATGLMLERGRRVPRIVRVRAGRNR
jgi:hypothetical protein